MREKPSPYNIIPSESISVNGSVVSLDMSHLNIPFTIPPYVFPKMGIPDTNSMDGLADYGNDFIYIQPDRSEHHILTTKIIDVYQASKGLETFDCVYRVMAYEQDDPYDFSKPHKKHGYAIHRIVQMGFDKEGTYFRFKGINNWMKDLYKVRPKNILMIATGVIY